MNSSAKRDSRYWLRLFLVGLFGGVTLALLFYISIYVEEMVRPAPSSICCLTPADLGLPYQNVTFTSKDQVTLSGWYIPSHNRATIILLHGYGANRVGMLAKTEFLARHGYGVLLYDLRAHGESGGSLRTYGWLDVKDMDAALNFLDHQEAVDTGRIGVLGFSIGGQVALRAAAEDERLSAIAVEGPSLSRVEDAPPTLSPLERGYRAFTWVTDRLFELRMGVSAPPGVVDVIPEIAPRPVLLIATGRDGLELRTAEYYYAHAGDPKILWQIPEAGHGGGFAARPAEYEEKVVSFFDQGLLDK